jgi:hypothetical protein
MVTMVTMLTMVTMVMPVTALSAKLSRVSTDGWVITRIVIRPTPFDRARVWGSWSRTGSGRRLIRPVVFGGPARLSLGRHHPHLNRGSERDAQNYDSSTASHRGWLQRLPRNRHDRHSPQTLNQTSFVGKECSPIAVLFVKPSPVDLP